MTIYHWLNTYKENIIDTIEHLPEELIDNAALFQSHLLSILED